MQIRRHELRLGAVWVILGLASSGCSNFVFGLESYIEEDYGDETLLDSTDEADFGTDQENDADESEEEEFVDEALCQEAADRLNSCGFDADLPDPCDAQAAAEAEVILELTCEEMDTAMTAEGPLPLCSWFGWNCDEDYLCGGQVPASDYVDLLTYSDIYDVRDRFDAQESFERIGEAFAKNGDLRGLFPVMMRTPLRNVVSAVDAGSLFYDDWGDVYLTEISLIFLGELRKSLVNQEPGGYWFRYFELTEDCTASPLRTGIVGLTTHLVSDIPDAVNFSDARNDQERDFTVLGDVLAASGDEIIDDLYDSYGIDGQGFLNGLFRDDWNGGFWGSETTSVFRYETIESKSWTNGLWLQNAWTAWAANSEIWSSFYTMDGILATLDQSGSI